MADDIEIHYDSQRGDLTLTCGDAAFARLRDIIVAEAQIAEMIEVEGGEVQRVEIEVWPSTRTTSRSLDSTALLVWGLVVFAVLFVLIVGLVTIAGWFK